MKSNISYKKCQILIMVCLSDMLLEFGCNSMVFFEKLACWWKPLVKHVTFPGFFGIVVFRNLLKGPIEYSLVQSQQWRHQKIMYQICSKLTLKKLGWRYWPCSVVFIVVSFEHILHTVLVFPLLALKNVFTSLKSTMRHQNDTPNMFKVNNKETKMTLLTSFWRLYCC